MARQIIDTTEGAGDTGKAGGDKANANFAELYALAAAAAPSRVRNWARSYRGMQAAVPLMASPPTITRATATAIAGSALYAYNAAGTPLAFLGSPIAVSSFGAKAEAVTLLDGSKTFGGITRIRFMTDAPAFELVTGYWQRGLIGLLVDGQRAFARSPVFATSAVNQYTKVDFGANAQALEVLQANPSAGGSGYVDDEIVTLTGGATVKVVRQTGGAVNELQIVNPGSYGSAPSSPVAQTATTGAGTGLTVTAAVGASQTTRRMRLVEIQITGEAYVKGITVDPRSTVQPWPAPSNLPKVLVVGDSQQEGAYPEAAGAQMSVRMLQRIGLYDRLFLSAKAGTGWNTDFGQQARWSHANRLADVVAASPDIVLHMGSQNDADVAATRDAVTASLNSLATSLPSALFVGFGSAISNLSTFTKAGYEAAAAYGSRILYVDDVTVPIITGNGNVSAPGGTAGNRDFYLTTDNTHLTRSGTDLMADARAARLAEALIAMAA